MMMKCKNCGNDLNRKDKFCKHCGFKSDEKKTSNPNIHILIIIGCLITLIVLISICISVSYRNYNIETKNTSDEVDTIVVYNLNNIEFTTDSMELIKTDSGFVGSYNRHYFVADCRVLNKYIENSDRHEYVNSISEERGYGNFTQETSLNDCEMPSYLYDFDKADLYVFENKNELYSFAFEKDSEDFDKNLKNSILRSLKYIESDFNTEPATTEPANNKATEKPTESVTKAISVSRANALKSAKSYLDYSSFSYEGLIEQLEYEKYSHEDAVYAADNCGADWNEQALKSAKSYLDYSSFSKVGLIEQLEYEKYTNEQAVYAADNCGADWYEQAVKTAKSYLDFSSFSRDGLIEQLEYEGFTHDQAVYGVEQSGL